MSQEIDNHFYETLGDAWWAADGPMALLQQINPTRAAYFRAACARVLQPAGSAGMHGARVLDVGCGGGYLAESFARAGCVVSGVDASSGTIAAARRHAALSGLQVDYRVADACALPYPDGTFDVVVSSDFLEHVSDNLDMVIAEQARVLRRGGLLGFQTVNRTWLARLALIWLAQDILRLVPRHLHAYALFVRPAELAACLGRHGLQVAEMHGLVPARNPLVSLAGYLAHRQSGGFRLGQTRRIAYIGYATKTLT